METYYYLSVAPTGQVIGQGSATLLSRQQLKPPPDANYTYMHITKPVEDVNLLWVLDGVLNRLSQPPSPAYAFSPVERRWVLPD